MVLGPNSTQKLACEEKDAQVKKIRSLEHIIIFDVEL